MDSGAAPLSRLVRNDVAGGTRLSLLRVQRLSESPAPDLAIAPFIAPPLPTRSRATTEPPRC
jgi:hypothetical protein